ncbi:hypothetical protein [Paenibacillus taiwanensis]|uniref:hypothetical protein n=1 Tax=Paenibacillus taiwanensis TaxID=401638 RepID=UPI00041D1E58|nr:hypothetical protein [Paenibacillus taiwanensis]
MEGWIKLHRALHKHWIYQDAEYLKVWIEMLFRAKFSSDSKVELFDGQLVELGYGEFIYGRKKWSTRLGISERRLRTLVDKLLNEEMLKLVRSSNKFSIYYICNYEKYAKPPKDDGSEFVKGSNEVGQDTAKSALKTDQQDDHQSDQQKPLLPLGDTAIGDQQNVHQNDQQATSKRPASDHKEECKELKELKERKEFEELLNTPLSNSEDYTKIYDLLERNFHQPNSFQCEDINGYLNQGAEYGLFEETVKTVKIRNENIGEVFRILKNCSYRGIKTKAQFVKDQIQFQQQLNKRNNRNQQYNKPSKPIIPIVKEDIKDHGMSQEQIEHYRAKAKQFDEERQLRRPG